MLTRAHREPPIPEESVGHEGRYFCLEAKELEAKELFPQRGFVLLLRSLHLVANFVFRKVRPLPFIDFSYGMID